MKVHLPHPRRAARERQLRDRIAVQRAVRRAQLADRTPQTRDLLAEYRQRQERGRR